MPAPKNYDYLIEKGIPIPKKNGHRRIYPFDKMEIGDSFLVKMMPNQKANTVQASIKSAAVKYFNTQNIRGRTVCRSISKNEIRVWRTE